MPTCLAKHSKISSTKRLKPSHKVVLDTNIIVSGLLTDLTPPGQVLDAWLEGGFTLVSSEWQLEEIRRISRYPRLRTRLKPHLVGRTVKQMRTKGIIVNVSTIPNISSDPDDNVIIATAFSGNADVLVSGDRGDLLSLGKVQHIPIVSARIFAEQLRL
ncbi:MAG: putative toxin-antitoxin system toxin component, PIN family [Trueperaceae bacterium]|nr:putative toxin-antitoxin system toxin component, PIN family [Trueperaceae bacterium]